MTTPPDEHASAPTDAQQDAERDAEKDAEHDGGPGRNPDLTTDREDPQAPPQASAAPDALDSRAVGGGLVWLTVWTARSLILALGCVLVGLLVRELWSILLPVVLALVITSVLDPPTRLLERRLRLPAAVAAALVIVVGVGGLVGIVALLAPTASEQVAELALSASDGLTDIQMFVQSSGLGVTDAQIESAVTASQERLQSSASSIASGVLVGLGVVASLVINAVITLILVFFFLKDGRRFNSWLRRWSGPHAGRHIVEVSQRSWETLGAFVRTQALVGLIDAVFIGAGLLLIGVPLALPLALLTFVAAFAPIVGAVAVGGLAVLVALASTGWVAALLVLAVVLGVQQLEGNVLLPWLQGRSLDLHAGVVLLSIVLGSTLFGVIGAFLAVPTTAVAVVVARYLNEQVTPAGDDSD